MAFATLRYLSPFSTVSARNARDYDLIWCTYTHTHTHTHTHTKKQLHFQSQARLKLFPDIMSKHRWDYVGHQQILVGQSSICNPAVHIDCRRTYFSHYTVLPAETLVFATSNKWLSISLYGVPDRNDTQMIHVPWKLFIFFLPMREGNAGLALQNTYLECTLDTLNN